MADLIIHDIDIPSFCNNVCIVINRELNSVTIIDEYGRVSKGSTFDII